VVASVEVEEEPIELAAPMRAKRIGKVARGLTQFQNLSTLDVQCTLRCV